MARAPMPKDQDHEQADRGEPAAAAGPCSSPRPSPTKLMPISMIATGNRSARAGVTMICRRREKAAPCMPYMGDRQSITREMTAGHRQPRPGSWPGRRADRVDEARSRRRSRQRSSNVGADGAAREDVVSLVALALAASRHFRGDRPARRPGNGRAQGATDGKQDQDRTCLGRRGDGGKPRRAGAGSSPSSSPSRIGAAAGPMYGCSGQSSAPGPDQVSL